MDTGNTFSNLGTGSQNVISSGTQNNNSGSGSQYNANTIAFHQHNQHHNANLLADLRVTDPRDDKTRIEGTKGGLLTDSYVWVLQNPDFCQWRDDKDQRLLWVKGDPGKGKTMLLCGIIDDLQATRKGKPLSYFFCQATDELLNTATAVLRGLIFMLLDQAPSLVSYIKKKYDIAGKALFQDKNAWQAMSEIFKDMLQDSNLQGVCLLVDALDECSTGLKQLLMLMTETSRSTSAKWLVSSRNWSQIEEQLRPVAQSLSLELNAESVAAAVKFYIKHEVKELAKAKKYSSQTRTSIRHYLYRHAGDTFLWAALVRQELKRVPEFEARERVKTFPPGLDTLYQQMMQQICDSTVPERCKQFLAITAVVYRPLSLNEYGSIYDLPSDIELDDSECEDSDSEDSSCDESNPDLVKSLRELASRCGSFLTIREDIVYFVHQSAKDFLMNKAYAAFDQIFPDGIAHQHHAIFSRSLEVLSKTLRRDIYELRNPGSSVEDISPPNPDPLGPVKYSCMHWIDHLQQANSADSPARGDLRDNGSVHAFLKCHYLHWLKAQSLLQGMPQAVLKMQKLQTLVRDVDWNACQQTLEGHSDGVWSVTFSPDGRQLASGSGDNTVKLWDTATGQCQQTLEGHSSLENVFEVAIQEPTGDPMGRVWEKPSFIADQFSYRKF
ncbi:hypothetical protein CSOJ01_15319 [Colletotrichum sojae]|uniref:NACHT domain-containing protein n=1 Tax=Colletotrichum sojae TaxID=2175907 RepID=A0A8H6INH9_9PEZI|nr:hypothetical protein CSOJ01_15319 [Colletotrichum sojae]